MARITTGLPGAEGPPGGRVGPSLWAAAGALAYFLWAGTSYDPRLDHFWTTAHGWQVLAPGLFHGALAAGLLFGALSSLAFRLRGRMPGGPVREAAGIAGLVILIVAAHAVIYESWKPLILAPEFLRGSLPRVPEGWRLAAYGGDIVGAGLLAVILWARGGRAGVLPTALFALHPLVLREAANGSWTNCVVPAVIFLAALSPRLRPRVREVLIYAGAAVCVLWFTQVAAGAGGMGGPARPFDGWVALLIREAGISGRGAYLLLAAVELVLQAVVCALAITRRWDLAKAWGHLLLAFALVVPTLLPGDVVLIVALLPLAWTRAGWVLSVTALVPYAAFVVLGRGDPWQLPVWMVYLMCVPAVVAEGEELVMEGWARRRMPTERVVGGAAS